MAEPQRARPVIASVDARTPSPGTARRTGPGHVVSYGEGRICAATGCLTRLSRYNGTDVCSARHEAERVRRVDRLNSTRSTRLGERS
jgi:hypothetical protein